MKSLLNNYLKKVFLLSVIVFFVGICNSKAEIYNSITVKGNKRLSIETVLMFSGLGPNVELQEKDLNDAIKKLYDTNYFEDIKILTIKRNY